MYPHGVYTSQKVINPPNLLPENTKNRLLLSEQFIEIKIIVLQSPSIRSWLHENKKVFLIQRSF